jgi:hypothetical protein
MDDSFGKALQLRGVSLSTFLASLATSAAVFAVEVLLYFFLRRQIPVVYKLAQPNESVPREGVSKFVHFEWRHGDNLDMYFFRRYLRTLVLVFLPSSVLITPILASLNFWHGRASDSHVSGLDKLGWSNVDLDHTDRYWGHLLLSFCLIAYVCWIIWNELRSYVQIRQAARSSALRTVLIDSIPDSWASEQKLRERLACFGEVVTVSFNRDFSVLRQKIRRREQTTRLLEKVATRSIKSKIMGDTDEDKSWSLRRYLLRDPDSIESYRRQLLELNNDIDRMATKLPALASAFITFSTPLAAHMACQSVIHCNAGYMTPRTLPSSPSDVIWDNVSMPWWNRTIRAVICNTSIVALSFICAIPISFSSLLSQAVYLSRFNNLHWIQSIPEWALGVIQGLLPPLCLAMLLRMFSSALTVLVRKQGIPLRSLSSLKIQDYYFFFLLTQVTLSVTLSAGITVVMSDMVTGRKVAETLAKNLPKASNYFLSYVILQALSISASALLRLDRLIDIKVAGPLLDRTVTQMVERQKAPDVEWGILIPVYTNLGCVGMLSDFDRVGGSDFLVGILYAIISPIILPFHLLVFMVSWVVHLRPFADQGQHDHGGVFYPKAIKHLFVGIYTMETGLLSLFLLVRDSQGRATCIGHAVLCVLALALTAVYHSVIRGMYDPLLTFLPTSIQSSEENTASKSNAPYSQEPDAALLRLPRDDQGFSRAESEHCRTLSPGVVTLLDGTINKRGEIGLA